MAKPEKIRIKNAVIAMFEHDRKLWPILFDCTPHDERITHLDSCCDIACDLLGIPEDNTVETGACDYANKTGEWPEWGFCRDYYYNLWFKDVESGEKFYELCIKDLKEYAERQGKNGKGN